MQHVNLKLFIIFIIFIFSGRYNLLHAQNLPTVTGSTTASSTESAGISLISPVPTIKFSQDIVISPVPTIDFGNSSDPSNSGIKKIIIPTVPSIPPIRFHPGKNINGLTVQAPSKLTFPNLKVSSQEQWTELIKSDKNVITVTDHRENNSEWSLTIATNDLTDGVSVIPLDNLYFYINEINYKEGSVDNISNTLSIRFLKNNEQYILIKSVNVTGRGIYEMMINMKLHVPSNTPAGEYSTNLVLTIS